MSRLAFAVLFLLCLGFFSPARGQDEDEVLSLLEGTIEFEDAITREKSELATELENHEELENKYFPEKYHIPVDFYV